MTEAVFRSFYTLLHGGPGGRARRGRREYPIMATPRAQSIYRDLLGRGVATRPAWWRTLRMVEEEEAQREARGV